jgi:hypothetical protein
MIIMRAFLMSSFSSSKGTILPSLILKTSMLLDEHSVFKERNRKRTIKIIIPLEVLIC